MTRIQLEKW